MQDLDMVEVQVEEEREKVHLEEKKEDLDK